MQGIRGRVRRGADRIARVALNQPRLSGPAPIEGDGPPIPRDRPLVVVSWNLQFAGGRDRRFFYDGGRDVDVPADEVERTLDGIGAALVEMGADVALLQEVDRRSRRTGYVDQHAGLQRRTGLPCATSTPYFRNRYVPAPSWRRLGPMDMHLSVLSRYRIARARRHPLAPLREPWLRQQFNLRRAVLEADLPVEGGGSLRLLDVHLSAFSRGDGTLERQVDELAALAEAAERRGPWLLAGDLNALPPGDLAARLPDPEEYAEVETPIGPLFTRFSSCVPSDDYAAGRCRTYLPPLAADPDRVLDYAFHGTGVRVESVDVPTKHGRLSDHLPLRIAIRIDTDGRPDHRGAQR